jgi:hypothetical protein
LLAHGINLSHNRQRLPRQEWSVGVRVRKNPAVDPHALEDAANSRQNLTRSMKHDTSKPLLK